jgi:dTDP-glucose 4,6-dehydratase
MPLNPNSKKMIMNSTILITGGSGFIGSNFIHYLFKKTDFQGTVINVDCLTYAGNPLNLTEIDTQYGGKRYFFEKADITDLAAVKRIFDRYDVDITVHFAAESHVDRSISGPAAFIDTNILGTFNLLETLREKQTQGKEIHFHHISTDEVYGSLNEAEPESKFREETPYDPHSPYSASKAASDHLVRAYWHTYGLPVTLSNCSNNYGPYQFPEKLIPLMINNMLEEKPLPVYGDGKNIRDWLYVDDHCSGIWSILEKGTMGETYNIGGENEWTNIDLLNVLCEIVAEETEKPKDHYKKLITYVKDRAGHDRRYAIDCGKIKSELGWRQSVTFAEGLRKTVRWYLEHPEWISAVKSGEYLRWIDENYNRR